VRRIPLYRSEKRLINPTTTGISPTSVQTKSEPDVAWAATIQTPKAISPTEIRYETAVSMSSGYRDFLRPKLTVPRPKRAITKDSGPNARKR
jgi:hypothetical protein